MYVNDKGRPSHIQSLEFTGPLGLGWRYRRWRMGKGTLWSATLLPLYLHPSLFYPYSVGGVTGGEEEGKRREGERREGGGGGGGRNLCFTVRSN